MDSSDKKHGILPGFKSSVCYYTFLLLLCTVSVVTADPFCDREIYGSPVPADCVDALSRFPQDTAVRFFVEQQMRTAAPQAIWSQFLDPRIPLFQETVAQLPKFMSKGTCNVALYSYTHRSIRNSAPAVSWARIAQAGMSVTAACLSTHRGGAAWVKDTEEGNPGLSVFVWASGAPFEFMVNQEMGEEYPAGFDPSVVSSVLGDTTSFVALGGGLNGSSGVS